MCALEIDREQTVISHASSRHCCLSYGWHFHETQSNLAQIAPFQIDSSCRSADSVFFPFRWLRCVIVYVLRMKQNASQGCRSRRSRIYQFRHAI